MDKEKNWSCHIHRTVKCEEKNIRIEYYHNVTLPFIPFKGLIVEYYNESFNQGSRGNISVEEFISKPIEFIKWNSSYESFTCYEEETFLEKENLGWYLNQYKEENWFPLNDDEAEKIKLIIQEYKNKAA